jgi:hypothetical protein
MTRDRVAALPPLRAPGPRPNTRGSSASTDENSTATTQRPGSRTRALRHGTSR